MKVEVAELAKNPMGFLLEAIHSAGYSGALASPLYAPESALDKLNGELLEDFMTVRLHQLLRTIYVSVITNYNRLLKLVMCLFDSFDLRISGEFHCCTDGTGGKWSRA